MTILTEAGLEAHAMKMLAALGWTTVHGPEIAPGEHLAERADYRETILTDRLIVAIQTLNPNLPADAVTEVVRLVTTAESQSLDAENWRAYQLLVGGIPVEYRDADGVLRSDRAALVNWDDPEANDLAAVNQFTIKGKRERRPDIVMFVNGLSVALLELKRPGDQRATVKGAFSQIQTYRNEIPDVFTWNQITVVSDGIQARAGSHSASWDHFAPWKTIDGEDYAGTDLPQIDVLIEGMFKPEVFFDLVRNFIAVYGDGSKVIKKVAKYHQYWAVRKAVEATLAALGGDGRIGIIWHTQGSGKSLEMVFYAGKTMRSPAMQNPTLIVLTDRNDLDDQLLEETFSSSKIGAPLPEAPVQAESRSHLKDLLKGRESGGIIFTTIQKFGVSKDERESGRKFPLLSDRKNIVVIVDEAHRSNYDVIDGFARHLRDGLPNASFIGFTGTPIETGDKSTRQIFGEYIDVYDMTQSVADEATVKVYYEPRLAKVELPAEIHEELDQAFTEATSETEEFASEKLKSRWARVEAIVGAEQRLEELAKDIVEHWETRRGVLAGKAMIVTMSRRIAVELYGHIVALRPEWHSDDDNKGTLKAVITGSATDSLDFQPHIRGKKSRNAIKKRASNAADPLELVIVRDMWLTGFDSPSMHTMYVDKPMRGASLMQAITRVNRKFKDKPSGLVVDYIGIAEDLKEALASYTSRDRENQEAGQDVSVKVIPAMLAEHDVIIGILSGIDWKKKLEDKTDKAYLRAIAATIDHLIQDAGVGESATGCLKDRFIARARKLVSLFTIVSTSPEAATIRDDVAFFDAVRGSIAKIDGSDREGRDTGAELDTAVRQIISEHMSGTGVIDIYAEAGMTAPDISLIDEGFLDHFNKSPQKNLQLEMLKRLLAQEIKVIGQRNVVAGKQFSEMLSNSLLRYQNRSLDTAQIVAELVQLAQSLKAESDRGQKLGLDDSELAFYDAIMTNESAAKLMEDDTMKAIAHELTAIVRRDAKTDWSIKEQVRAKLRSAIKRLLLRYGYPPDQEASATDLILRQAELMSDAETE